jgi:hypothetical protein
MRRLMAALALLLLPLLPAAAAENVVPSCYARYPVNIEPAGSAREVYVLVDQTTALDPALTATLRQNVARLIRPGTGFVIASFSAFERGHYTEVIASGRVEPPVPVNRRNSISVPALKKLDACLKAQLGAGIRVALAAVARAQQVSAASFAHSEIMASLKHLSARIAASRARDKVVIVVSDMLEHSSATSFYAHHGLRTIQPLVELRKAVGNRLIANFAGARAYVIGAGILPPESRDAGRTITALNALESFWAAYFRQSGARLMAFGKPNLVSPIP